jgi:hypothetical protein
MGREVRRQMTRRGIEALALYRNFGRAGSRPHWARPT